MRLIDADALKKAFNETDGSTDEIIDNAPTVDAVEVVRCKDCKHFSLNKIATVDGTPLIVAHEICDFWGDGCKTKLDGFCSYGEREDDGSDNL